MVKCIVDGKPHIFLKALVHINPNTEIQYDYGQRSAPWKTPKIKKNKKGQYTEKHQMTMKDNATKNLEKVQTSTTANEAKPAKPTMGIDAPNHSEESRHRVHISPTWY